MDIFGEPFYLPQEMTRNTELQKYYTLQSWRAERVWGFLIHVRERVASVHIPSSSVWDNMFHHVLTGIHHHQFLTATHLMVGTPESLGVGGILFHIFGRYLHTLICELYVYFLCPFIDCSLSIFLWICISWWTYSPLTLYGLSKKVIKTLQI